MRSCQDEAVISPNNRASILVSSTSSKTFQHQIGLIENSYPEIEQKEGKIGQNKIYECSGEKYKHQSLLASCESEAVMQ